MASTPRAAMRLLSPRLRQLQHVTPRSATCFQTIRASSRYSNPASRKMSAATSQAPSFVGQELPHDVDRVPEIDLRSEADRIEAKRQYHFRRMRTAGLGLIISLAGLIALVYNIDLDELERSGAAKKQSGQQLDASDEVNKQFQGKEVHVIGAGDGKRIVAQGQGEEIELVETGTSSVPHFPRIIYLPTSPESSSTATTGAQPNTAANPGNQDNQEEYTLIGLGIRSVSFLSIQVYVVGMYIRTQDISGFQARLIHEINEAASTLIPAEKEELRRRLLDPAHSREIWSRALTVGSGGAAGAVKTAWRIAPTRNTDFGHLRDGWVTGINNRTREARALARADGQVGETEFDSEEFGAAIGSFKALFAGGKAPKGSVMVLARDGRGALDVWFQEKPGAGGEEKRVQRLGGVADERISRLIWLGYLAGEKVSSEAARKGVAEGCVGFAARPVGSVETMVT